MNRLSRAERAAIIRALVEGNSLRSVTRITDHSINTVSKLLVELGAACAAYQDEHLRDLPCQYVECDEIWAFCHSKAKNVPDEKKGQFGYGDVWTFTAIDAATKLMPSWMIGDRTPETALAFMQDLASRLANRVQLSTDGHRMYLTAVPGAFANDIDFGQMVKIYGTPTDEYGHGTGTQEVIGVERKVISGDPEEYRISTSYVERANLTMRMGMRRFTRLTNAFSKKVENHAAAIALHFFFYNYGRVHKSLANPYPRTPAMAAGIADHVWTCEEIAALLD
ncbi:MAG: IS1 family transposase [Candidatus Limnocylindrales bacterium]|jgi:IS1 family transposase